MADKPTYVTNENLRYFWEKVKEFYDDPQRSVAAARVLVIAQDESVSGEEFLRKIITEEDRAKDAESNLALQIQQLDVGGIVLGPVSEDNVDRAVNGADVYAHVENKVTEEKTRAEEVEDSFRERIESLEAGAITLGEVSESNTDKAVSGASVKTYVDQKVLTEETRAKNVENFLSGQISDLFITDTTLSSRLTTVEESTSALSTSLSEEIARATTVEEELLSEIETEKGRAGLAETTLGERITAEETIARATEQALSNRVTDLENSTIELGEVTVENTDNAVSGASVKTYVDQKVSDDISAASTSLQAKITEEETRAKGVESSLQSQINAIEAGAITLGEVTIENTGKAVSGASVVTYVTTVSSSLQAKITGEETRAKGVEQAFEIRIANVEGGAIALSNIAEGNTNRAVSGANIKTYVDQKVLDEETRAKGAESALGGEITAEENRAKGVEANLLTAITTETSNRTSAISTLSSSINTRIEDLETANTSIATRLTSVENGNITLGEVSASNTDKAASGKDVKTYVDAKVNEAVINLSAIDGNFSQSIAALNASTSVLQTNVGTLQTDVGTLQTDVGTLQGSTTELQTSVSTLQTDVDTLQTDVGTLQTDVEDLKNQSGASEDLEILRRDVNEHLEAENNPHRVTAAQLGLGNVQNTADLDKPISTATQTALDELREYAAAKESTDAHIANKKNPHEVTAKQIGLEKVINKGQSDLYTVEDVEYDAEAKTGRYFTMQGANSLYVQLNTAVRRVQDTADAKVDIENVRDGLEFTDTDKPLSANQGMVLNGRMEALEVRVGTLGSVLVFKDVVLSQQNLPNNADVGDVYQVSSTGLFYVWNGTEWVQITVNVDILNYLSTVEDAYEIIDNYQREEEV